jgi:hypothetical protein
MALVDVYCAVLDAGLADAQTDVQEPLQQINGRLRRLTMALVVESK